MKHVARLAWIAGLMASAPVSAQNRADLVFVNARIYTVDEARPRADAMAVRAGRIVFVGSNRGALTLRGPDTRVVDLDGRTVIPGMVDAHAHLLGLGEKLRTVDLVGTRSYEEVVARVRARADDLPEGSWILARGWDQNDWRNTDLPTHQALSRAIPDHPVLLTRIDGHATLANARAMALAGVTRGTADPAGGRIIRLPSGEPSGVFVDHAQALVNHVVPEPTAAELRERVLAAIAEANRWGLTGLHDAGAARATIDVYEDLAREGRFSLRNYVMISDDSTAIAHYFQRGPQNGLFDGRLWIRAIKVYMDGALGSRGAALLDAYSDDPGNSGLLLSSPEHVRSIAVQALEHGFQLATHAIGDRANRLVLDEYEAALREVPTADHRFRVEHAQILNPIDIPRFASLGVIPSMQASHQTSDMYWVEKRLGPNRLAGAYAWRSLLDAGVKVPNGSDFPVEAVNPLISFHAAITRQDASGFPPGGWFPAQRMTRAEALQAMTLWPAYAAFQETDLGSLAPGKYADFVVLDRDIMRVAPDAVLGTRVLATYLGGRPVYQRRDRDP